MVVPSVNRELVHGQCEDSLFHSAIHVQTQDTALRSGYDAFLAVSRPHQAY
jgi:hypothetical protein